MDVLPSLKKLPVPQSQTIHFPLYLVSVNRPLAPTLSLGRASSSSLVSSRRESLKKTIKLTNRKRFSVVRTFIENDIRHHRGQNVVDSRGAQYLPQYSSPKRVFISERDQNHDTKKEQALSILGLHPRDETAMLV